MTTITGGSITYARGRQPEQYGNQKAECTLSFGIADDTPGEKISEFILHVGDLTMVHVNRMLKVGDHMPGDTVSMGIMTATRSFGADGSAEPNPVEPKTRKPPRVPKDQGEPVARTPEQSVEIQKENGGQVDGDPNPFGGTTVAAISTATASGNFGEQTVAPVEPPLDFNAAEEITDLDLGTAMNKRAPELGPKAKELIFGLLGQFGVASGGNHRSIPQEKRAEFLEKLHALKTD